MKYLQKTIALLLLTTSLTVSSQKLNKPVTGFSYACVKQNFNSFNVKVSFTEKTFNADNVFNIELSDKDGNFGTPVILTTVNNKNTAFSFDAAFAFPETVYGDNYKIRVRSTSPAITSEASNAFNAYYVPNTEIILNNYEDIDTCDPAVTLNITAGASAAKYIWYKNGMYFKESEGSIEVTEPGEYYVEPYYGECTGTLYSNIVAVNLGEGIEVDLGAQTMVELCEGQSYTLQSSYDDQASEYRWYRNGELIETSDVYMPSYTIIASDATYGKYELEVTLSRGCTAISNSVEIKKSINTYTVEATTATDPFLFDGESVTLAFNTSMAAPSIVWYRNDQELSGMNTLAVNVTEEGEYYAKISGTSECSTELSTPVFTVEKVVDLKAEIGFNDEYIPCESTSADVIIKSIVAIGSNGNKRIIAVEDYDKFDLVWYKNNSQVYSNKNAYTANSYGMNGEYWMKVIRGGLSVNSNMITLSLGLPEIDLVSQKEMVCDGVETLLTATNVSEAIYSWYNDELLLAETFENSYSASGSGNYRVEVTLSGCARSSVSVEVKEFSEDSVTISTADNIEIKPNSRQFIEASGAEKYLWKNQDGVIMSSSNRLEVSKEGVYTLEAYSGECMVIRMVYVSVSELLAIPNVISPNNDNINDKWVLPAKLSGNPEVEVVICDSYGKPVLRTNAYQNDWPSSTMNKNVGASIYYYFINENGKSLKKGSITLIN